MTHRSTERGKDKAEALVTEPPKQKMSAAVLTRRHRGT